MSDAAYIAQLAKAFSDLHGCIAQHVETVPVVEHWRGKVAWEGEVEVFDLTGHPKAYRGYAWSYDRGDKAQITAVLELPPVISPVTAVRAAIVAEAQNKFPL